MRAGGYLIAPAAAALLLQPLSAVFLFLGVMIVYGLTRFTCEHTLMVGLNRYNLTLYISTVYVWAVEALFLWLDPSLLPFQGSGIFVIVVIMSYVNDVLLYGRRDVLPYMLGILAIASGIYLLAEFLGQVLI
jgi:hypothetical protein